MEGFNIITGIIVTLTVVIILSLFFTQGRGAVRDITDKEACKKGVEANALFIFDKLSGSSSEIKCPTLFITSDSNKQDAVFGTLALALADTWDEFLEGKKEIFETETQNYCVIRRVVKFVQPEKYKGFMDYLFQKNYPGANVPYFSYLTDVDVAKGKTTFSENQKLKDADVIDTSSQYAVVFIQSKKESLGRILLAQRGAVFGGSIGLGAAVGGTLLVAGTGPLGLVTAAVSVPVGASAGAAVGGLTGFLFGSSYPAKWASVILLIPYTKENIDNLNCTKLPVSITATEKASV